MMKWMVMTIFVFILAFTTLAEEPICTIESIVTTENNIHAANGNSEVGSTKIKTKNRSAQKIKTYGFEYFPLKTDVFYTYDSNAGDTKATVNPQDGELVLTFKAGSLKYEQQFFKSENGIYLTRTESKAMFFFGNTVTYPEPVLRLPLPLHIGDAWQWEGLEVANGDTGKLSIQGQAIAEEIINTPMGSLTCLKIRLSVDSEYGAKNVINEWLAPEIGIVKFHANLKGKGITGFLQNFLGLNEITFSLNEISRVN